MDDATAWETIERLEAQLAEANGANSIAQLAIERLERELRRATMQCDDHAMAVHALEQENGALLAGLKEAENSDIEWQKRALALNKENAALRETGIALFKWLLTVPNMEPPMKRFSIPDELFEPFQDALFDVKPSHAKEHG